jgi:hypothetical protein
VSFYTSKINNLAEEYGSRFMPKAAETALWKAFLVQKLLLKINSLDLGHPKWPRKIIINQCVAILNGCFGHPKCLFGCSAAHTPRPARCLTSYFD